MIFPFPQNWRTSLKPHSLSLMNTVNTGTTFTTPSGAMENSKIWASAGFRGFGPTMTFPGAGMDGMGCGCGGGGGHLLWALGGFVVAMMLGGRRFRAYGD
jgi:hypothetical protein